MAGRVDPAMVGALGLDPNSAKITPHGGSGFASTFKLRGTVQGKEVNFFVKTGSGKDAEIMFRGEHASLNAIHATVPDFCPKSHAHGSMSGSPGRYFLATDFLDLGSSSSSTKAGRRTLASKLAQLHTTLAPAMSPDEEEDVGGLAADRRPMFGFPVPTCCGATVQENSWRASWADFYADNRLRAILRACVRGNGADAELESAVERLAAVVVPRLLGDGHLGGSAGVAPVVVHGDLWSGNSGVGRIAGADSDEEVVVFDPSSVYAHSEYELGIMRMFGGFGNDFWREYGELVPKTEPREEWDDRVALYEIYHHLNHFALFGGGYRGSAMSIAKTLIAKYAGP